MKSFDGVPNSPRDMMMLTKNSSIKLDEEKKSKFTHILEWKSFPLLCNDIISDMKKSQATLLSLINVGLQINVGSGKNIKT